MSRRKVLRLLHLVSTVWLILCAGYILVFALRQAGFHWWIIFSLSGHSVLIVFLFMSVYLFAIFKGVGKSKEIVAEHPLTSTGYYTVFYIITPFLGGLAGWVGMIGVSAIKQVLLAVAMGTFVATFLNWVIVDPVVGLLEMVLPPSSRKHRSERLAQAKAEREKRQKDRERLLADVLAKEQSDWHAWQGMLRPEAEKLAELLTANSTDFKQAECEAADIGVKAWQIGGLGCMRQLHDMAIDLYKKEHQDSMFVDYISTWWDGIGSWRSPSLKEIINL
jgi:large-conductance mechanosensitive channel